MKKKNQDNEMALMIRGNFSWGFSDKVNESVKKKIKVPSGSHEVKHLKNYI